MNVAGVSGWLAGNQFRSAPTLQQSLQDVQATEVRLLLTGVVVLLCLGLVTVVLPWLARKLGGQVETTGRGQGERDTLMVIQSGVRVLFLRGLQLATVLTGALVVIVVWGRVDEAVGLLDRGDRTVTILGKLVVTLCIGFVAYVAMDVLDETIARFSDGADRITDHQEEIVRRVGQLGIIALVIATSLTVWGVDLSGLLVGAGFLGIVVGLAARQTLGSLIAGFVLMFSRPFTIGDWVEIGDQEGIVTDITIVNTRLENFDGEFVVIPNDMVGNKPITNRSQKGHLRIRLEVGVDYDSDPDHARDVALDAMREVEAIEQTPPPQAFLKSFGDSAVLIEIRFWIDRPTPPRKWQATNAVVEAVKGAFDREGIKIPFPQRELSGRAETGGFQVRSEAVEAGEASRPAQQPPRSVATRDGAESGDGSAESAQSDGRDPETTDDSQD